MSNPHTATIEWPGHTRTAAAAANIWTDESGTVHERPSGAPTAYCGAPYGDGYTNRHPCPRACDTCIDIALQAWEQGHDCHTDGCPIGHHSPGPVS